MGFWIAICVRVSVCVSLCVSPEVCRSNLRVSLCVCHRGRAALYITVPLDGGKGRVWSEDDPNALTLAVPSPSLPLHIPSG